MTMTTNPHDHLNLSMPECGMFSASAVSEWLRRRADASEKGKTIVPLTIAEARRVAELLKGTVAP